MVIRYLALKASACIHNWASKGLAEKLRYEAARTAANEEPEVKRPVVGGVKRKRLVFTDSDEDAVTLTYAATSTAVTPAKTIVPPRDDLEELQNWNSTLLPPANGLAVSKDTIYI